MSPRATALRVSGIFENFTDMAALRPMFRQHSKSDLIWVNAMRENCSMPILHEPSGKLAYTKKICRNTLFLQVPSVSPFHERSRKINLCRMALSS